MTVEAVMKLRDYQTQGLRDLRNAVASGYRSPLYVLPTGGGKTAVAVSLISQAVEKGKSALFLAPRRELIYQTCERLYSGEIEHGVIMSGERPSFMPQVQVACVPTLYTRADRDERFRLPPAQLVLVDEAHIGIGGRAQEVIQHYQQAGSVVVGLTATPARTDGRGLGTIYDTMVQGPTVRELIDQGYLVPPRYFVGTSPDRSGVDVQGGDYNQGQLGRRADDVTLIGDVVSNWARLASDRQTFVFAVNVAHSRHLCERFLEIGVAAEHIDGKTENEERKAIQRRLREGKTQVLCNCEVMTYGVDFPPVSCIVLAKSTKSVTRGTQMVGRGMRTHPGKEDLLVLDHAGVIEDIGFVDDPMPWSLNGKEKIQDRKAAEPKEQKYIECGDCGATFRAAKQCPNCGHEMGATYSKAIEALEAELQEIRRGEAKKKAREWTMEQKAVFYGELKGHAQKKGYQMGWAAHAYKERFGVWPKGIKDTPPVTPSAETQGWIQHLNIRRAKRREKGQKAA